jgi:hypothetical protein
MMMMNSTNMFIGMFIIQYIFMSYVMTNNIQQITHSNGKIYMSTIMGLFMVVLGILLNHKINKQQLVLFTGCLFLFIYLYKIQFGIDEKNYLQEMIEHHSMAILTSKQIINKTKNSVVSNFAKKIVTAQEKEIEDMRYILKSI